MFNSKFIIGNAATQNNSLKKPTTAKDADGGSYDNVDLIKLLYQQFNKQIITVHTAGKTKIGKEILI